MVEKDPHGRLRAKFVPVTTGITGATDIEVLSGLKEGQEIVTGPYKTLRILKDGSLLETRHRKSRLTPLRKLLSRFESRRKTGTCRAFEPAPPRKQPDFQQQAEG